ncbi:MAG: OmpA family protein [Prevotellaceae bacterium]|nr:OmpA family protein [Prevotellaceae bacterium]
MKKLFIATLLLGTAIVSANAQTAVVGNKFSDNWSLGIYGGGVSPLHHGSMRGILGISLDKKITPVVGFGLEFAGTVNTTDSKTGFDNSNLMLVNNLNLMNLFGGYKGRPRVFEIETVVGLGWLHYYYNSNRGNDHNNLSGKLGLDLNFNLGESKAWTLALKPALVYDLNPETSNHVRFNSNDAVWELTVGLKYHFKTSNGEHYFTRIEACDQSEIDALNAKINALREDLAGKDAALNDANQKNAELAKALEECLNKEPEVITEPAVTTKTLESVITFRQGSTAIDASQTPNVERIATYLKNHNDASVIIKGYASPEGSIEVNERIAAQRAEAVKTMLTGKYKISADRIQASGEGVGDMFEEPDWNRVSICTINNEN